MTNQLKQVWIWTDGSCNAKDKIGGWGCVLQYGETIKQISGGQLDTTVNQMELTAAVMALEALKYPCFVVLTTDSEYLKNGITEWLPRWVANGWRTADKKPVKNRDLWVRLAEVNQKHKVSWQWVKGHAGNEMNELADQLAGAARLEIKRMQTPLQPIDLEVPKNNP